MKVVRQICRAIAKTETELDKYEGLRETIPLSRKFVNMSLTSEIYPSSTKSLIFVFELFEVRQTVSHYCNASSTVINGSAICKRINVCTLHLNPAHEHTIRIASTLLMKFCAFMTAFSEVDKRRKFCLLSFPTRCIEIVHQKQLPKALASKGSNSVPSSSRNNVLNGGMKLSKLYKNSQNLYT